jgi:hypothetical protein
LEAVLFFEEEKKKKKRNCAFEKQLHFLLKRSCFVAKKKKGDWKK